MADPIPTGPAEELRRRLVMATKKPGIPRKGLVNLASDAIAYAIELEAKLAAALDRAAHAEAYLQDVTTSGGAVVAGLTNVKDEIEAARRCVRTGEASAQWEKVTDAYRHFDAALAAVRDLAP